MRDKFDRYTLGWYKKLNCWMISLFGMLAGLGLGSWVFYGVGGLGIQVRSMGRGCLWRRWLKKERSTSLWVRQLEGAVFVFVLFLFPFSSLSS